MRWCVIRHPELGVAIVAEDSLPVHEKRGWVRTSPLVDDKYSLHIADHPLPEPEATDTAEQPGDAAATANRPATKTRKSTED